MKKGMKKWISLLLVTVIVAVLVGCEASTPTPAQDVSTAPAADGGVTVALVCSNMADTYYTVFYDQLNAVCKERGYTVQNYDAQAESAKQVNMISNAIAQKVNAIIFDPIDSTALGPVAMEAKKAGIIVITIVTDLDAAYEEYRDCYVGPDDIDSGLLAAEAMKAALPNGGKVVAIEAAAGSSCQILRQDGFEQGIKDSNIELLDAKTCDAFSPAEAQAAAEDFLIRHGDDLDGIFVHWDDAGVGVKEAIEGAGYKPGDIPMVTVDGSYGGFDLVRQGWSYACIYQSIPKQVEITMNNLDTILNGGTVDSHYFTGFTVVTLENVDEFDPGW